MDKTISTIDLVNELRDWAEVEGPGSLKTLLDLAADRLEEIDERLAIVGENLDDVVNDLNALLVQMGTVEVIP